MPWPGFLPIDAEIVRVPATTFRAPPHVIDATLWGVPAARAAQVDRDSLDIPACGRFYERLRRSLTCQRRAAQWKPVAGTEQLISTVAAAIAALAASASLFFAWRSLKEGQNTISQLRLLHQAAQAETAAERKTTLAMHLMLSETEAARDFELLRLIARHIPEVTAQARRVQDAGLGAVWHDFNASQELFAALLATLPAEQLPRCHELAKADPRRIQVPADQASDEIRLAIKEARQRLEDVSAAANAQLKQLTT